MVVCKAIAMEGSNQTRNLSRGHIYMYVPRVQVDQVWGVRSVLGGLAAGLVVGPNGGPCQDFQWGCSATRDVTRGGVTNRLHVSQPNNVCTYIGTHITGTNQSTSPRFKKTVL